MPGQGPLRYVSTTLRAPLSPAPTVTLPGWPARRTAWHSVMPSAMPPMTGAVIWGCDFQTIARLGGDRLGTGEPAWGPAGVPAASARWRGRRPPSRRPGWRQARPGLREPRQPRPARRALPPPEPAPAPSRPRSGRRHRPYPRARPAHSGRAGRLDIGRLGPIGGLEKRLGGQKLRLACVLEHIACARAAGDGRGKGCG